MYLQEVGGGSIKIALRFCKGDSASLPLAEAVGFGYGAAQKGTRKGALSYIRLKFQQYQPKISSSDNKFLPQSEQAE